MAKSAPKDARPKDSPALPEGLVGDTPAALKFLQQWSPNICLLSAGWIDGQGNKGLFETQVWKEPVDWAQVALWIDERQGNANLYYSVNPPKGDVDSKTSRSDVLRLVALHVDSDVRPDEPQEAGIQRIVDKLAGFKVPPSIIVISGGGGQALWRLTTPVPVNGDVALADDLARYNIWLQNQLDGDRCHDISRILRVPGTINLPDVNKLAKGRVPALARVYSVSERTYDLSAFEKGAAPEAEIDTKTAEDYVAPEKLERIKPDDGRLVGLDAKWLKLALEGDTEGKYRDAGGKTDRSRMVLAFASAAMRAKIPNDVIAAIIMDSAYIGCAHVWEKKQQAARALRRVMMRAAKFIKEDFEKPPVFYDGDWINVADVFVFRAQPNLRHCNGRFFLYKNGCYEAISEDALRSAIRKFLHHAKRYVGINDDGSSKIVDFNPSNADVSETLSALRDMNHIEAAVPSFLEPMAEGLDDPKAYLNCRNGLLHVPTRTFMEHTPELFSVNQLEFDYEPTADTPALWLATMRQYWVDKQPGEMADEILLLQEIMGYLLLPDTSLQKLFAIIGPTRSGKGTIARVIRKLLGDVNCAAPSLNSLSGEFGQAPLVDKTCAIISELGFGARADRVGVTDFIKRVSGEDTVEINRKNAAHWLGQLIVRFLMLGNMIPNFADDSRALGARLVALRMTMSFEGVEDPTLSDRLLSELPGILNWALAGYDRLKKNGRFTNPTSSEELREDFGRAASPIRTFVEETCTFEWDSFVTEDALFAMYDKWLDSNGYKRGATKAGLIDGVVAGFGSKVQKHRLKSVEDKKVTRPRGLKGLRLVRENHRNQGSERSGEGESPELDGTRGKVMRPGSYNLEAIPF